MPEQRAPDDLVAMYEWRNGQGEEALFQPDVFAFRDNTFVDLAGALEAYPLIVDNYAPEPGEEPYEFDLAQIVPFATFMGSSYVVVCGPHRLASPCPNPVVSLFQGVDLYFHSIETMLRTCIEWVRHPEWSRSLPPEIELEIWRRHNPGVFES